MIRELVIPSFSTCSLRIYASSPQTDKPYLSNWHIHNEIEIILLLSGRKNIYINEETIVLEVGDILFINSNIPHKTETPIGSSCILLQFNEYSQKNIFSEYFYQDNFVNFTNITHKVFKNNSKIANDLSDCIQKISKEYSNKEKSYDFFIRSYLYELTAILYRNEILLDYNEWQQKVAPLRDVFQYIERNYNVHISLTMISEVLNFHTSYFCKYFKDILGISFVEYLNLFRLNKSKILLKETSKSITEISNEVGFSSVSYFIKTFKKYNYCTPNKYRSL